MALWNPVDVLVYEQMQVRRQRRAYSVLQELPLEVGVDDVVDSAVHMQLRHGSSGLGLPPLHHRLRRNPRAGAG